MTGPTRSISGHSAGDAVPAVPLPPLKGESGGVRPHRDGKPSPPPLQGRISPNFHVRSRQCRSLRSSLSLQAQRLRVRVMREQASAAELSSAVIVNTCAVTAEAVRQARQAIRRPVASGPTPRSSSQVVRRRSIQPLRRHGRGRSRHRQSEKLEAKTFSGSASTAASGWWSTTSCRCARPLASDRGLRQSRAPMFKSRTVATIAAPSASSLRPRAVALGSRRRGRAQVRRLAEKAMRRSS